MGLTKDNIVVNLEDFSPTLFICRLDPQASEKLPSCPSNQRKIAVVPLENGGSYWQTLPCPPPNLIQPLLLLCYQGVCSVEQCSYYGTLVV